MGRSSYTQSVSSSTRTFQTTPPTTDVHKTPAKPKLSWTVPKLLRPNSLPANRLPWLIAAGLFMITIFMFAQYREAQSKLDSPQAASATAKQVNDTLAKVSKLVIVPPNETPTVVTVADTAKLRSQSFFVNAKTGDKVIVYARAKVAILYRPSTNQIVTMAPVTGDGQ